MYVHGSIRWLVALAAIAAVALTLSAWVQHRWSKLHTLVMLSLPILLTLQLVLGGILLFSQGSDVGWSMSALRLSIEHAVTMLIAVGLSHMMPRMVRTPDLAARAKRSLFLVLAIAVLVALGVIRLRGAGIGFLPNGGSAMLVACR